MSRKKIFIVSHSVDTSVTVEATDAEDAAAQALGLLQNAIDWIAPKAFYRLCDVANGRGQSLEMPALKRTRP